MIFSLIFVLRKIWYFRQMRKITKIWYLRWAFLQKCCFSCSGCSVDILPKEHLSILSHSTQKFLQHSISNECLEAVDRMIFTFCQLFQKIYGKRYMLSNIHQLLPLCTNIRNLWPIWTHPCFPFEEKNWFILQLIPRYQKIEFQSNSVVNIAQSIPTVL